MTRTGIRVSSIITKNDENILIHKKKKGEVCRVLYIIILIFLSTCGVAFFIVKRSIYEKEVKTVASLIAAAETIGYTPPAELIRSRQCNDLYSLVCTYYMHFSTPLNYKEFSEKVAQNPQIVSHSVKSTEGERLFTEINLGTHRNLFIDGHSEPEYYADINHPLAYEWTIQLRNEEEIELILYQLNYIDHTYSLDDNRIFGNIVSIKKKIE